MGELDFFSYDGDGNRYAEDVSIETWIDNFIRVKHL